MYAAFAHIKMIKRHNRKAHGEGRSLVYARTGRFDRPTMKFNQMPHNRQTQPHAPMLTSSPLIGLTKSIEHMRQEVGSDPLPGVGYNDFKVLIYSLHSHLYSPSPGREFDGIG